MGNSDGESIPTQPEGGLLPLLGDMLFAGAILVMIYPSLRRTIKRLDRQFFRQLRKISEVILALAALWFVLMLMIAQQTRVTYCSFIRPYWGDTPDDDIYVGVLLKFLVCALLVFNYFCASGLQRIVSMIFERFHTPEYQPRSAFGARPRHANLVAPREVLSNNSNTNSQTPVPQTPTETQSDIFSSVSFPALDSKSFEDQSGHTVPKSYQRLYCDVGTMVRFPEFQNDLCTLQFCKGHVTPVVHHSIYGSSQESSCTPRLYSSSFKQLHSSTTASTGFCSGTKGTYQHSPTNSSSSHLSLDSAQSRHHHDIGRAAVTSSHQGALALACVQNNCGSGSSITHVQTNCRSSLSSTSSHPGNLVQPRVHESDLSNIQERCPIIYGQPGTQGGNEFKVINTASSCRSSVSAIPCCSCYSGTAIIPSNSTAFRLPRHGSTVQVKRRSPHLLSMPKMTRSGKVYGYG